MTTALQRRGRPQPGHEERLAHTRALLHAAAQVHEGSIVLASSFGAEDMVLTDLIARDRLPIA